MIKVPLEYDEHTTAKTICNGTRALQTCVSGGELDTTGSPTHSSRAIHPLNVKRIVVVAVGAGRCPAMVTKDENCAATTVGDEPRRPWVVRAVIMVCQDGLRPDPVTTLIQLPKKDVIGECSRSDGAAIIECDDAG